MEGRRQPAFALWYCGHSGATQKATSVHASWFDIVRLASLFLGHLVNRGRYLKYGARSSGSGTSTPPATRLIVQGVPPFAAVAGPL